MLRPVETMGRRRRWPDLLSVVCARTCGHGRVAIAGPTVDAVTVNGKGLAPDPTVNHSQLARDKTALPRGFMWRPQQLA